MFAIRCLAICTIAACSVLAAPIPKAYTHSLGKEWVKRKDVHGNDEHTRKIELTQLAIGTAKYFATRFPLSDYQRNLNIRECLQWNGRAVELGIAAPDYNTTPKDDRNSESAYPENLIIKLSRTEDNDSKPVEHYLRISDYHYFDYDGDGRFDGMCKDYRTDKEKAYIFVDLPDREMETIRIRHGGSLTGNGWNRGAENFERTKSYTFDKGNWRERTDEDRRKLDGVIKPKDK